jgi:hypothetical protein
LGAQIVVVLLLHHLVGLALVEAVRALGLLLWGRALLLGPRQALGLVWSGYRADVHDFHLLGRVVRYEEALLLEVLKERCFILLCRLQLQPADIHARGVDVGLVLLLLLFYVFLGWLVGDFFFLLLRFDAVNVLGPVVGLSSIFRSA